MKNKNKLTELPVTIITDDEHQTGDHLELARQRIEKAALYLMSIFNLIKVVAQTFENRAETREMAHIFGDVINHCEIGGSISDSILASASALTEFQTNEPEAKQAKVKN